MHIQTVLKLVECDESCGGGVRAALQGLRRGPSLHTCA